MHPYVKARAEHWLSFMAPAIFGDRQARACRAYVTPKRIYTETICLDRETGRVLYGTLNGHVVESEGGTYGLQAVALWDAIGWRLLWDNRRVSRKAPAYLPQVPPQFVTEEIDGITYTHQAFDRVTA